MKCVRINIDNTVADNKGCKLRALKKSTYLNTCNTIGNDNACKRWADGTPEEVFSQVELLHSIGLAAPESVEMAAPVEAVPNVVAIHMAAVGAMNATDAPAARPAPAPVAAFLAS